MITEWPQRVKSHIKPQLRLNISNLNFTSNSEKLKVKIGVIQFLFVLEIRMKFWDNIRPQYVMRRSTESVNGDNPA